MTKHDSIDDVAPTHEPRALDEWPAFVAWCREKGYDLNDRAIKHVAWGAWMTRAAGVGGTLNDQPKGGA